MEYEELEEYLGDKNSCDNCDSKFEEGEVIVVEKYKRYIFCYNDSAGSCMIDFALKLREALTGVPMRFKGNKRLEHKNPMPKYPNTPTRKKDPMADKKKAKDEKWLRKVLGSLKGSL